MAESEILKVILQGGSFGLLAIAVVWMLYYGAPMIRDTLKSLSLSHESVQNNLMEKLEILANKLELQAREQTVQVTQIVAEQTRLVTHLDSSCREERLAMAKMLAALPAAK